MVKEWRVRGLVENDLLIYSRKLQSILNRMENDGFDYILEGPGAATPIVLQNGEHSYVSMVTGSREKPSLVVKEEVSQKTSEVL